MARGQSSARHSPGCPLPYSACHPEEQSRRARAQGCSIFAGSSFFRASRFAASGGVEPQAPRGHRLRCPRLLWASARPGVWSSPAGRGRRAAAAGALAAREARGARESALQLLSGAGGRAGRAVHKWPGTPPAPPAVLPSLTDTSSLLSALSFFARFSSQMANDRRLDLEGHQVLGDPFS